MSDLWQYDACDPDVQATLAKAVAVRRLRAFARRRLLSQYRVLATCPTMTAGTRSSAVGDVAIITVRR